METYKGTKTRDDVLYLQGLVGRAAKLQAKHHGHAMHDLKLDSEMEQHVDIPQTELLLSFLPEVFAHVQTHTALVIADVTVAHITHAIGALL